MVAIHSSLTYDSGLAGYCVQWHWRKTSTCTGSKHKVECIKMSVF